MKATKKQAFKFPSFLLIIIAVIIVAGIFTTTFKETRPDSQENEVSKNAPASSNELPTDELTATIFKVTDGDTFQALISNLGRDTIRLVGIDAPETYQSNQPYEYGSITDTQCLSKWGTKATNYVENTIERKEVFISYDANLEKRDNYGRLLAYVEISNKDLGTLLVKKGYARVYTESGFNRKEDYLEIQQKAKSDKKGLWECRNKTDPDPTNNSPSGAR